MAEFAGGRVLKGATGPAGGAPQRNPPDNRSEEGNTMTKHKRDDKKITEEYKARAEPADRRYCGSHVRRDPECGTLQNDRPPGNLSPDGRWSGCRSSGIASFVYSPPITGAVLL